MKVHGKMFSNNLKEIRERKKITQFELSKKANVTPADISRIENGKIYAYPGWRKRISDALEVETSAIWDDER
ncbi:Helix-turn-helix domain-containing protein [Dethiosulfatibacter aminovorans DSM 17477]|uniref:Helix-turn-helix domain-containing protein n=1 Tax=Dethiosulfatibacter aminovorans DSM 17477 TaxID=1121476 RepID=A0A1M6EPS6_9FIRM|nr:helix-turn-helix transcriptional regulator [Dethiosulfatibacter aminovorans]SHI87358.1 Helix-turn-helix domain-containing protein [Dethiosulfatibacter aminovorans DSM 17477]